MPQKEDKPNKNQWFGVDQRVDPLLLPANMYQNSNGMVFRQGFGARLDGKKLFKKFDSAVVNIFFADGFAVIQTMSAVYTSPLSSIFS